MKKYLYEASIARGRNHPEHKKFRGNVDNLNAKAPDYSDISKICIIAHHMDSQTVHLLCTDSMQNIGDVTIEEITKSTINNSMSHHGTYTQIINKYFTPHHDFLNL